MSDQERDRLDLEFFASWEMLAREEMDSEWNARYDYIREAYGPTAEGLADEHEYEEEEKHWNEYWVKEYGPYTDSASTQYDMIPF